LGLLGLWVRQQAIVALSNFFFLHSLFDARQKKKKKKNWKKFDVDKYGW
jgi:hypothetical protein